MLSYYFWSKQLKWKKHHKVRAQRKTATKTYIDAALFRVNPVVMTTIFLDYRETHITPRKVIQDNLIFWIVDSGLQGLWTLESGLKPSAGFRIPWARFTDSGSISKNFANSSIRILLRGATHFSMNFLSFGTWKIRENCLIAEKPSIFF